MPTARELLDQADALMRRNRPAAPAPGDDGIPTLMDIVPAPPKPAERAEPSRAQGRDPVLQLADVPLLTDAVEEIEAPSILEEPFDEPLDDDDPQAWTDTLTGAHTIIPGLAIDLPAPVAQGAPAEGEVGVLPEEWSAVAAQSEGPALAVETIDIPAAPDSDDEGRDDAPPLMAQGSAEESIPPAAEPADLEQSSVHDPSSFEPAGEERVAPSQPEQQPATPFEWPAFGHRPSSDEPGAAFVAVSEEHLSPVSQQHAAPASPQHPATASSEQAATASAEYAATGPAAGSGEESPPARQLPDDEARWHALAEEIRMQVLQRIDLFTDTGLREQLAARLQPIVDRAGADLVATINQHVGVLLRAYVAEAIEREIERWRADGR